MDAVLSPLKKSAEIRMIRVHLRSILLVKKVQNSDCVSVVIRPKNLRSYS